MRLKTVWWLDNEGNVHHGSRFYDDCFKKNKEIGNYFDSEEEAKRAVEKLKALKRLRDKGFRFTGYSDKDREYINQIEIYAEADGYGKAIDLAEDPDVKLLFGGEE